MPLTVGRLSTLKLSSCCDLSVTDGGGGLMRKLLVNSQAPIVLYALLISILSVFLPDSLLLRFTDDTFDPEQTATIGLCTDTHNHIYTDLWKPIII